MVLSAFELVNVVMTVRIRESSTTSTNSVLELGIQSAFVTNSVPILSSRENREDCRD